MPGLSSPCTAGCFKNHTGCGVHRSGQTPVFLGPEATTVNDRENFPHSLHAHGLCSWLSLTPVTGPCGCVALPQQVKPYRQSRSHQHLQPRGWLPSRQRHCILAKAQAVSCSSRDERAEPSEARSPALSREHWAPASPAQKRRHSWASVDAGTQPPGDGGTPTAASQRAGWPCLAQLQPFCPHYCPSHPSAHAHRRAQRHGRGPLEAPLQVVGCSHQPWQALLLPQRLAEHWFPGVKEDDAQDYCMASPKSHRCSHQPLDGHLKGLQRALPAAGWCRLVTAHHCSA